LGPFLSKSVSTTISPGVITDEALTPFRAPAFRCADGNPSLARGFGADDHAPGHFLLGLVCRLDQLHGLAAGFDRGQQKSRSGAEDPGVESAEHHRHKRITNYCMPFLGSES